MGRGDIKTKRGKISNGTFGVSRPHKKKMILVESLKKKKKVTRKTKTTE
jgi:30S ribosomal protein S31